MTTSRQQTGIGLEPEECDCACGRRDLRHGRASEICEMQVQPLYAHWDCNRSLGLQSGRRRTRGRALERHRGLDREARRHRSDPRSVSISARLGARRLSWPQLSAGRITSLSFSLVHDRRARPATSAATTTAAAATLAATTTAAAATATTSAAAATATLATPGMPATRAR